MTLTYWIAVLLGAISVLLVIKYTQASESNEHFLSSTTEHHATEIEQFTTTSTPPQNATSNNYTETLSLAGFPSEPAAKLGIYLTSFSDIVAYTEGAPIPPSTTPPQPETFNGQMGVWRDLKSADNSFRLQVVDSSKGVIPTALKVRNEAGNPTDIGLSINALRLVGPSSRAIGERIGSTSAYALTPFTAAFFGIIEDIDFADGEARKVLFRITAEHPDRIEIAVRRRDNRNVLLEVILGDAGRAYQWVVDKYMLMSNRLPTLYALTYDKGSKVTPTRSPSITLYIGKTKLQKVFTHSDAPQEVRLGNSEIVINPDGRFNMKLITFAYFKSVQDDRAIDDLNKYFTQQQSGIDVVISKKKEEYEAITTELQKKLESANRTLEDAETELKKCHEAAKKAVAYGKKVGKKWQVKLDSTGAEQATSQLSEDDIAKCAPLALASKLKAVVSKSSASSGPKLSASPESDPNSSLAERLNAALGTQSPNQ